jgi:hypothetical protein
MRFFPTALSRSCWVYADQNRCHFPPSCRSPNFLPHQRQVQVGSGPAEADPVPIRSPVLMHTGLANGFGFGPVGSAIGALLAFVLPLGPGVSRQDLAQRTRP